MRYFLLIGLLFLVTQLSATSTTKKINHSKHTLSQTNTEKKRANRKLAEIAKDIKHVEKEVSDLDKKLELLSIEKERTEELYQKLKIELEHSEETLAQTNKALEKKRKDFIKVLSEQFSVIFAMKQFDVPSEKSIVSYEVYRAYQKYNNALLQRLEKDMRILKKSKKAKTAKRDSAKKSIAKFESTRKRYVNQKKKQEKLMARLNSDEEKYQSKLQALADKQSSLRSTLAKLNILHTKEVEEARKKAKARRAAMRAEKIRLQKARKARALARKKAAEAKKALRLAKTEAARKAARAKAKQAKKEIARTKRNASIVSEHVRKINSSYHKGNIVAYRGNKTISPIPGARLIKKFGTYTDPIYKMKIFNESITLKAPSANAKVRNVLDGKVVFAGKSSMLGKVVVVAHSGKMHTVYAGLSKIAPTIKTGRKIKKGYIVGRVARKLMFEATKNSKHINPTRLIRI